MRRVLVTVVGAAVLAFLIVLPALGIQADDPSTSSDEETTISTYDAVYRVAADGDLAVTETLHVDFPFGDKHGIFRFFDRHDPSATHTLRTPHDISVSMDGQSEPFSLSHQSHDRYVVARIGDPDVLLPSGTHVYTISYRVDGVLEPGTDGARTQFYWNVIPGGWNQSIQDVHLVIHLPAPATPARCALGNGATGGCTAQGEGTTTLRINGRGLAPHTPVTLQAGLDLPTPPAGQSLPWPATWAPVLGDSVGGVVVVLVLALVAGGAGAALAAKAHERRPAFPVQYAPPPDVGPAEAAYVMTEKVGQQDFVASMLWAAQEGAIDLKRDGDAWTITDKGGPEAWAKLDRATTAVAPLLGGAGGSFTASRKDVASGQILQARIAGFEKETKDWGLANGFLTKAGLGGFGGAVVLLAAVVTAFTALTTLFGMSISGLVPGAFTLAASPLLSPTAATRRTPKGRDLWSRLGGFERMLSTPSSKQRFDFSGRQDVYTAYIPWAVAFGCADAWAKKYRTEVGAEPPVPAYFAGYYAGAHTGDYVSSLVQDFNSTVSSSISAYQATQSHSSGGGGFSGGGGGGGGGGGSW
ncbi:MAG TPA: DUF2207 domain-containing protein [Nocardioides sp.]|nr:DUF2207 domain-containing protein [Nocardioides sp.]